jgi:hypothetical protein
MEVAICSASREIFTPDLSHRRRPLVMITRTKAFAAAAFMGAAVLFTPVSSVAAQTTVGDGLVNVAVGDVTILEDVNVAVAADVTAMICGLDVGPVAILGEAVDRSGETRTVCQKNGAPVTIIQA